MDFITLLREHAGAASRDERFALYESLRARVDRYATTAEGEGERLKARAYRDALELAIVAFEAERDEPAPAPALHAWKPPAEPAPAASTAQPPDGPAPAPSGRGGAVRLDLAGRFGVAHGAGALAAYQTTARSPAAGLVERYREGRAASEANVALVRSLRAALDEHRRSAGGYPATGDTWTSFAATAEAVPALKALLAQASGPKERLLYRGSASDFKLIVHQTGDCFIIKLDQPDLVDPVRSAGQVDCYAYGFWTSGAAAW